jgi:hypothetical protein
MVGVRGFEPPAPSSRTRCATRLRYTPPRHRTSSPAATCLGVLITGPWHAGKPNDPQRMFCSLKRHRFESTAFEPALLPGDRAYATHARALRAVATVRWSAWRIRWPSFAKPPQAGALELRAIVHCLRDNIHRAYMTIPRAYA